MIGTVISRSFENLPFCEKEILRYAGVKCADESTLSLMRQCIEEAKEVFDYRVCYGIFSLEQKNGICDFGSFRFASRDLSKALEGCHSAVLFAATLGVETDRLLAKYGRISPSRALMLGAVGTAQAEELCDVFCRELQQEKGFHLTPRFSPGYGDLPLAAQRDLFFVLDCPRRIGLTLSDSFLMSPSKSVTAIAGIGSVKKAKTNYKCQSCKLQNCAFRGNK